MKESKSVGSTKDAGFQIGVRKTFDIPLESAWEFFFSKGGVDIWLGKLKTDELTINSDFETKNGITGKVRVFKHLSHIRMTWKKKEWNNTSALQIRIIPSGNKSTISFHQDHLTDTNQREEMKNYWDSVIEKLSVKLV